MEHLALFARGNQANKWLEQNPVIFGLIVLAIGLVVGGNGLYELSTGVSRTKSGKVVTGTQGQGLAIFRIVVGVACILFAVFKMLF